MKAILLGILFLSGTFVVGQPADTSSTEIKKINGDREAAVISVPSEIRGGK